ncbi:ABC transporter permease [Allonocardiopsis opalescens]|uniref:ABC-type lipoprotein release transport system permease subunit n=1 Tax=Allonocardiopsis opalescens TaxID=1144618 RepID=A0A2T0Q9R7_9ACTN|nr:ABC transporter permease [Allonocardiopsis opalescens]PRY00585.1 ABC-type lipoprotein release transport system permease subunit [Allonocardiopsis opalescens]
MFFTYLRRELANRRRQSAVVAAGMALAITLVIIVSSLSAGVEDAQDSALSAVYGVGTDITVSSPAEGPNAGGGGGQRFQFGAEDGERADGSTSVVQSRLHLSPGTASFSADAVDTVRGIADVEAATATLSLTNVTFEGEMPDPQEGGGMVRVAPGGGADGEGGSSFDVTTFSVLGLDPGETGVGPLTSVAVSDGRAPAADDAGTHTAVLDNDYATGAELAVGDTLEIGGTEFEIVGLVASTAATGASAADVYIPLDTAQELAELDGEISDIYVQATSATAIDQVQADIEAALPDATVNTQQDLASTVSGSLATAASLLSNLGTWLSVAVLAAAFLIAALLTMSGVARRTREFGTLKAIGWSNGRVVRQVAGESLVQAVLGGLVGSALGVIGVLAVNAAGITLSSVTDAPAGPEGEPAGGGPVRIGPGSDAAASTADIVLNAPVSVQIVLLAVGLAALGGLVAGASGGWRAARLRPAEALRAVN